jgi:hypothetical protein
MRQLSAELAIDAPADQVWEVIGPGFARIGEWASVIHASAPIPGPEGPACAAGAPATGRVCATGVRLLPRVTETLIAYDQSRRTLTYQAGDLPALVTLARNTWTVVPAGERRCRVRLQAQFQARGAIGVLVGWAAAAQAWRNARLLEADLGHYMRHGTPSPRKQRQLRRSATHRRQADNHAGETRLGGW